MQLTAPIYLGRPFYVFESTHSGEGRRRKIDYRWWVRKVARLRERFFKDLLHRLMDVPEQQNVAMAVKEFSMGEMTMRGG
jgi:hypothetical protein